MRDLFETPELIPAEVMEVLNTFDVNADDYHELDRVMAELEPLGYVFNFYLGADPYGLRPIGVELNELEDYEDA